MRQRVVLSRNALRQISLSWSVDFSVLWRRTWTQRRVDLRKQGEKQTSVHTNLYISIANICLFPKTCGINKNLLHLLVCSAPCFDSVSKLGFCTCQPPAKGQCTTKWEHRKDIPNKQHAKTPLQFINIFHIFVWCFALIIFSSYFGTDILYFTSIWRDQCH